MKVTTDYITLLPKEPQSPKVTISDTNPGNYKVEFIDTKTNLIVHEKTCSTNQTICGNRQWYIDWKIVIKKDNKIIHEEIFNPKGKTIFIKIDARALGDNLAWMPYIEEFRKKHKCTIICSTFFNYLFESQYPSLTFVPPDTLISKWNKELVYAQYYVGTHKPDNICYSPFPYGAQSLQKIATEILGLEFEEIKPKIITPKTIKHETKKTVCISQFASHNKKEWPGDWQEIVDFLLSLGYQVKVISKEPTNLKNIIDKTGNFLLEDRIADLMSADFHIGVSSGLAWLAWAVNTHVFLISDYTPPDHEFNFGCTRIYSDKCRKVIVDEYMDWNITEEQILSSIKQYLKIE